MQQPQAPNGHLRAFPVSPLLSEREEYPRPAVAAKLEAAGTDLIAGSYAPVGWLASRRDRRHGAERCAMPVPVRFIVGRGPVLVGGPEPKVARLAGTCSGVDKSAVMCPT
jgi:hypothetical protein